MNLAIAATVFGLVALAELPDKTMIATIVLASRHRPLPVWIGAAGAMLFNSALAVGAGRLLELLPHRAVEGVVAALFLAGSLYLLLTSETTAETANVIQRLPARKPRSSACSPLVRYSGMIFWADEAMPKSIMLPSSSTQVQT